MEPVVAAGLVAAAVSAVVSVVVARVTAKATVRAAEIPVDSQERGEAVRAFLAASTAWQRASKEDARFDIRRQFAQQVRLGLLEVTARLGTTVSSPELEELLEVLQGADETQLIRAAELWPTVERNLRVALPRATRSRSG